LKPRNTKITQVRSAIKAGSAIREVIGKLMNGVTSNRLPTRMKRKREAR